MKATAVLLASLCVAVSFLTGCSADPATLESYEFWDGTPNAPGAQRVVVGPDGSLSLRLGRCYTARAYLRTSGRSSRCVYRVFRYSWYVPSRDFHCLPETGKRMVVDEQIAADLAPSWFGDIEYKITVAVDEYEVDTRSWLQGGYTVATIPVVIVQP